MRHDRRACRGSEGGRDHKGRALISLIIIILFFPPDFELLTFQNISDENNWKGTLLSIFEFGVWGITICAMTLILYYTLEHYSAQSPNLNLYFLGLIAGVTGGFWSFGFGVAYDFAKDIQNKKIDVNTSFKRILLRQGIQFLIFFAVTIIMALIIAFC